MKFDFEMMWSEEYSYYAGAVKKYPTVTDFIRMVEEKEKTFFVGDHHDVQIEDCRFGYYQDDCGDMHNGYHFGSFIQKGKGTFQIWVVDASLFKESYA